MAGTVIPFTFGPDGVVYGEPRPQTEIEVEQFALSSATIPAQASKDNSGGRGVAEIPAEN
jgi:hypothetical protein